MDLKIQGRIIAVLPEVGGVSKAGNTWKKQEYVLETFDQYPRKICFNAFGAKVDEFAIQEGETLTVSVDIESREFNGRWYTDIRAWRVERGADTMSGMGGYDASQQGIAGGVPSFAQAQQVPAPTMAPSQFDAPVEGDDLPF